MWNVLLGLTAVPFPQYPHRFEAGCDQAVFLVGARADRTGAKSVDRRLDEDSGLFPTPTLNTRLMKRLTHRLGPLVENGVDPLRAVFPWPWHRR